MQRVAEAAAELELPLYVVGGFVRDLILGKPGSDLDLVVEGKAEALARALSSRHGGKVTVHSKFGTAKWSLRDSSFHGGKPDARDLTPIMDALDFISARSETYAHQAALPTVKIRDD